MLIYVYSILLAAAIFQIVGFLLRVFTKTKSVNPYRKRLRIYGSLVFVYLLLLILASVLDIIDVYKWDRLFIVVFIFVIPSLLAIYYWNAIYRKYDENQNT